MPKFETVMRTPELGPGDVAEVHAHGRSLALANVAQTYYAVDAECPIDGTNLAREGMLDGEVLKCPHDDARFDVRTGERLDAHDRNVLRSHRIRVEGNEVRVGPPRETDAG